MGGAAVVGAQDPQAAHQGGHFRCREGEQLGTVDQ